MNRVLFTLAFQSIRKKKRSSILLALVFFLSFVFAIMTLSITGSMEKTNEEYRYDTYGTWTAAILDGNESELERFEQVNAVGKIGTSVLYGKVAEEMGLGVLDENFKTMGRIQLHDGRFPEKPGEIAMEADILSRLGYSYELGQEITLDISFPAKFFDTENGEKTEAVVEKTYTLCGVIREYSGIWCIDSQIVPGAVVTAEEAQQTFQAVQQEYQNAVLEAPVWQYFFHESESAEKLLHALRQQVEQLREERESREKSEEEAIEEAADRVIFNSYSYGAEEAFGYHYFYLGMIFFTTSLAVICIYLVQLQKQVRQIALFRSIGITKKQLKKMLFFETLLLLLPAMLLGTAVGAFGTWAALKLLLRFSSGKIYVVIPVLPFFLAVLVWLLGILLVRIAVFWIALRQPLIGRMQINSRKLRRYRRFKRMLVKLLSAAFCATLLLGIFKGTELFVGKKWIEADPSYNFALFSERDTKLNDEMLEEMQKIPGIRQIDAWGKIWVDLHLPEETQLLEVLREAAPQESEEGLMVNLYGIREEDWKEYLDFEALGIDEAAFRMGSQAVLLFSVNSYGEVVVGEKGYQELGIQAGDTFSIDIYGKSWTQNEISGDWIPGRTEEKLSSQSMKAAAVLKINDAVRTDKLQFLATQPYTILCSAQALEKMLQEIPAGFAVSPYNTAEKFGYCQGMVYTNANAGYVATDYVIADFCSRYGISMESYREQNAALLQETVQQLVQMMASGGSILLIALLLIWNTLSLAAEEEKKKYAILSAIGMSKRQAKVKICKEAAGTGLCAILGGWLFFGLYQFGEAFAQQRNLQRFFEEERTIGNILVQKIDMFRTYGMHIGTLLALTFTAFAVIGLLCYLTKKTMIKQEIVSVLKAEL